MKGEMQINAADLVSTEGVKVDFWGVDVFVPQGTTWLASSFDKTIYAFDLPPRLDYQAGEWLASGDKEKVKVGKITSEHGHYLWAASEVYLGSQAV